MFKRKPKTESSSNFSKSVASQNAENDFNVDIEDLNILSIADEISIYNNFKPEGYTVEEILQEYHQLNNVFVEVMDRLSDIFEKFELTYDDIIFLKNAKYYYFKRNISPKEREMFLYDIYRNILQVTFQQTIRKLHEFFGNSYDDWDLLIQLSQVK